VPKARDKQYKRQEGDSVDITYYTDPLCCWSWAFEPQWRKLKFEYGEKIRFRYCMGGLLPGWKNFYDPVNSVSRPLQMGPVWMHASQLSGMPIQHNLWMKEPPASSYPACLAVKCAELQSLEIGERYLRLLREAVMLHGFNIAKEEILINIAEDLEKQLPIFNSNAFKKDLKGDNGIEAFRKDLHELRYYEINRFPTLILRHANQPSVMIQGHRPYIVIIDALKTISPNLQKVRTARTEQEYTDYWGSLLPREIQEGISQSD
jgi:predicted DsbA family dithiol-disulfide isomerase